MTVSKERVPVCAHILKRHCPTYSIGVAASVAQPGWPYASYIFNTARGCTPSEPRCATIRPRPSGCSHIDLAVGFCRRGLAAPFTELALLSLHSKPDVPERGHRPITNNPA